MVKVGLKGWEGGNSSVVLPSVSELQLNEHREERAKDVVQKRDSSEGLPFPEST